MTVMGEVWRFMGTPLAFRMVSGFFCGYVAISTLGRTGSYLDAFNAITLFMAIWALGYHSSPSSMAPSEGE